MKKPIPKAIILMLMAVIGLTWTFVDAVHAQAGNGISQPTSGDTINGIVVIEGTATHPRFLRYELAFIQESRPGADWIVFAQGDRPVVDDALAVWDTTVGQPESPVFPDGQYRLRLRVVRDDYNYDEYYVTQLLIANLSATPSPSATLTTTAPLPTALPSTSELEATRRASGGALPTLTPFPTPSPLPTPVGGLLGASDQPSDDVEEQGGLLDRLLDIETSQFGRAFWLGFRIVFYVFTGLLIYLLLRGGWRRMRRAIRRRWYQ